MISSGAIYTTLFHIGAREVSFEFCDTITVNMSIKKLALIGGVVFLAIVVLALCISAKFSLTNIIKDPYVFISSFFSQWSPALSALGVIIASILALIAIYEGRRSQRIDLLDQQLSKVEMWASDNVEILENARYIIKITTFEFNRMRELENEGKMLEEKKKTLENKISTDIEAVNKLTDVMEKLIKVNEEQMAILERSMDYLWTHLDEIIKLTAKLQRSQISVLPIINSIRDPQLAENFIKYQKFTTKMGEACVQWAEENKTDMFEKVIPDMLQEMQNLVSCTSELREKIIVGKLKT